MVSFGENRGLAVAGMETPSERVDSMPKLEIMHSPHLPLPLFLSTRLSDLPARLPSLRRRVLYHLEPRVKNSISNSFKKNPRTPGKGWRTPRGEQEDIAAFLRYIMSCEISRRSPSAVRYRPQELYSSNPNVGTALRENSNLQKKKKKKRFEK